jgi:hypothetical protein
LACGLICRILITVAAVADGRCDAKHAQKKRDLKFIGGGDTKDSNEIVALIEKAYFAKRDKN